MPEDDTLEDAINAAVLAAVAEFEEAGLALRGERSAALYALNDAITAWAGDHIVGAPAVG